MILMFGLLVAAAIIFGFVGVFIARNKSVSDFVGFAFGAVLGPLGLIIVGLLNPTKPLRNGRVYSDEDFGGERVLTNDAYRLWLSDRYHIRRHAVLASYVCDQQLFQNVDHALEHAEWLHQQISRSY